MFTLEQAMAKAAKLLKLSESSNANEAALAASMAQKILARYNIDMAALDVDAASDAPKEPVSRDHSALENPTARLATWKHTLAHSVGKANQCRVFAQKGMFGTSLIMVGRASDVAKVRYLYALLASETDKLTATQARGKGRGYANSFRIGVVAAIGDKLAAAHAQVAADMRAENTGAALVRIDKALARVEQADKDVELWVRQNMKVGNAQRSGASNGSARAAGYAAGQSINVGGSARGALGAGQGKLSA